MNKMPACKINDLKYPASDLINSRISTLCRSMACTLMHRQPCSPEQERDWLVFFPGNTCAYCGKPASHLDHLYPMIVGKHPTGYGTEPGNLVPCCKDCNQPKGKMDWEDFMRNGHCEHVGSVKNADPEKAMEERIDIIKAFQSKMPAQHVALDSAMLQKWDDLLEDLDRALKNADIELNNMKKHLYPSATSAAPAKKTAAAVKTATSSNQKLVFDILNDVVAMGKMTPALLMQLQQLRPAGEQFGVSGYPILIEETAASSHPNYNPKKYYQGNKLTVGSKEYFVCSQWTPNERLIRLQQWHKTL